MFYVLNPPRFFKNKITRAYKVPSGSLELQHALGFNGSLPPGNAMAVAADGCLVFAVAAVVRSEEKKRSRKCRKGGGVDAV